MNYVENLEDRAQHIVGTLYLLDINTAVSMHCSYYCLVIITLVISSTITLCHLPHAGNCAACCRDSNPQANVFVLIELPV